MQEDKTKKFLVPVIAGAGIVIGIVSLGGALNRVDGGDSASPSSTSVVQEEEQEEVVVEEEFPNETLAQENARKSAESYLKYSAFSRLGLIEQLEYEGYSKEDSEYAVDVLKVDWNEQAAKSAETYMKYSSFSKQGLLEQLEYEGFTKEQAGFGVTSVGY